MKKVLYSKARKVFKPKVLVCKKVDGGESDYFLRIHLQGNGKELIRFDTGPVFTKKEADSRVAALSYNYSFDRDELPTHDAIKANPKIPNE